MDIDTPRLIYFKHVIFLKGREAWTKSLKCREREKGSFKQRVNFSECINLVRSLLKVISSETLAASNV